MTKRMLEMIMRTAQQRRFAGQPRPQPVPGRMAEQPPAYMTSGPNPHAWGAQRLMYGIQSMMRNAVAQHKEEQITKATADWEYAQAALNEYYQAQSSGDASSVATAQKKLDVVFGDPKKLKNMAKALNQDWLNPEKTTVYGEALKRTLQKTQQGDQAKQQARGGIMNMFRKLIGQGQPKPQLTPDEQKRMEQEIIEKAPTTVAGFDLNAMRTVADFERAAHAAATHYKYSTNAEGDIIAENPLDPKDVHVVRDDAGNPLKGKVPPKEGTLYTVNGAPMGVFHGGQPVKPGDPKWSTDDQKMFDQGVFSLKEKQFLRVPPEIAAIVGDPPDPKEFAKGRSDPGYRAALAKWGDAVYKKELEKVEAGGIARAKAFNMFRPLDVMDADGNVYYTTAQKAIEEGFAGSGAGIKLRSRESQMKDIDTASGRARQAIVAMDKKLTASQIARLKFAMTTDDETLARTEMKALASEASSEKEQDFMVWISQLNERAMSLRSVAGLGSSAQDMRDAIRSLLPNIGSGSTALMLKQLDAFDQQVKVLKDGIAHPGKGKKRTVSLD